MRSKQSVVRSTENQVNGFINWNSLVFAMRSDQCVEASLVKGFINVTSNESSLCACEEIMLKEV